MKTNRLKLKIILFSNIKTTVWVSFLVAMIGLITIGCTAITQQIKVGGNSSDSHREITKIRQKNQDPLDLTGNYVSYGYHKRHQRYDWVAVSVWQKNANEIKISVRSRADIKKPTCTGDYTAYRLDNHTYQSPVKEGTIVFSFQKDTLSITSKKPENNFILNFYCSGGGSLGYDKYTKIDGALDQSQIDSRIFQMGTVGKHVLLRYNTHLFTNARKNHVKSERKRMYLSM